MPDPTCPHEDCTETVTHWHDAPAGKVFICPRTKGGECLLHVDPEIGCYAPRTQPAPLDAILADAEDAKRAHDRLCDLAETLLPAPQPAPAEDERIAAWDAIAEHPIFAPCYATSAPLLLSMLDRLDGLDTQPAPQPPAVDPADVRVGDRVRIVVEGVVILTPDRRIDAADLVGLLGDDDYSQSVYLLHREPEDPRVAVVVDYFLTSDENARDLLARLDAMGADQ